MARRVVKMDLWVRQFYKISKMGYCDGCSGWVRCIRTTIEDDEYAKLDIAKKFPKRELRHIWVDVCIICLPK